MDSREGERNLELESQIGFPKQILRFLLQGTPRKSSKRTTVHSFLSEGKDVPRTSKNLRIRGETSEAVPDRLPLGPSEEDDAVGEVGLAPTLRDGLCGARLMTAKTRFFLPDFGEVGDTGLGL